MANEFKINRNKIWQSLDLDEYCYECPHLRETREEMGLERTCHAVTDIDCHRVDSEVSDIEMFVDEHKDTLQFLDTRYVQPMYYVPDTSGRKAKIKRFGTLTERDGILVAEDFVVDHWPEGDTTKKAATLFVLIKERVEKDLEEKLNLKKEIRVR